MKCIYLGRTSFTSKKGTACFTVNFGIPFDTGKGDGYRAANFFVNPDQFKDFDGLTIPCAMNADVRFINGAQALISYDIGSENIDLWD